MRSFNCVPEPNAPAEVDEKVEKYLIENIDAIDHPTTTPRPSPKTNNQPSSGPKFDEQTFELPEDMPAVRFCNFSNHTFILKEETSTGARSQSGDLPPKRIVGGGIPVAQPYEESVIQATLNDIQRQANQKSFADSDAFRAKVHGAPTLTADTPALSQQQTASNSQSLLQSHSPNYSPYYAQQEQQQMAIAMRTNPLDPFGLFGSRNPFGWYG
jgi:hypothetical protein